MKIRELVLIALGFILASLMRPLILASATVVLFLFFVNS